MADVSTPRDEWTEDEARRALPLALLKGISALKEDAAIDTLQRDPGARTFSAGNRRWLWPNPGEMDLEEEAGALPETIFAKRIRRLRFNNVFRNSLESAAAMPYRNPIVVAGWPAPVEKVFADADGCGNDLTDFARMASLAKFFAGIHFGLVEVAEDGSAVRWAHVKASALRNWYWGSDSGRVRLLQANIEVCSSEYEIPEDPNDYDPAEPVQSVMVYRAGATGQNYQVMRYDAGKGGEYEPAWDVPRTPGRGVTSDIPLVPFYSSWGKPFRSPPKFEDAAHDQMEMVRQTSELDDMKRRAKKPLNVFSGVIPESQTKGFVDDGEAIFLHDPQARGALVQLDASSIRVLADEIERGETAIRMACLDPMVMQPTGTATATEIGLREIRATTWLEASAKSDEASLRQMALYTAQLLGLESSSEKGTIELPSGFMEVFGSQEKTAELIRGLYKDRLISRRAALEALRNLEVGLPEDLDPEEEAARLSAEGFERGVSP